MHWDQQLPGADGKVLRSQSKKRDSSQMLAHAQCTEGDDPSVATSVESTHLSEPSPALKMRRKREETIQSQFNSSKQEESFAVAAAAATVRRQVTNISRPQFSLFVPNKELEEQIASIKGEKRKRELSLVLTPQMAQRCEALCEVSLKAITPLKNFYFRVQINSFRKSENVKERKRNNDKNNTNNNINNNSKKKKRKEKFSKNASHLVSALWTYEAALLLADSYPSTLEGLMRQGNYFALIRLTGPLQVFFSSPMEYFVALGRWIAHFSNNSELKSPTFAKEDVAIIVERFESLSIGRNLFPPLDNACLDATAAKKLSDLLAKGGSLRSERLSVVDLFSSEKSTPSVPDKKFGLLLNEEPRAKNNNSRGGEAAKKPQRKEKQEDEDRHSLETMSSTDDDSSCPEVLPPLCCGDGEAGLINGDGLNTDRDLLAVEDLCFEGGPFEPAWELFDGWGLESPREV